MRLTLQEIAERLGIEFIGSPDTVVTGMAGIDEAGEGDLTFVANPRYRKRLATTRAAAAIVPAEIREAPLALLVAPNPYLAFALALEMFYPASRPAPGIAREAWIDPSARLGADVTVMPFVWIGPGAVVGARSVLHPLVSIGAGASLGEDCLIHPQVTIRDRCVVGNRVILHSGVVIGADGFGFVPEGGRHRKIPQVGIVRIEDDVEIGASSCVDRATMGETRIGRGTKIDNLVQVAHNVRVGEDAILVSQVGISGSASIGDRSVLGGQVGVVGHIRIGSDVKIGAKSGIHRPVADGSVIAGIPGMPYLEFLQTIAVFKTLPQLRGRVLALEKEVESLKAMLGDKAKEGG